MGLYVIAAIGTIVVIVLAGVQLHRVIVGYRKATGTPWQRFLAAFSDSVTILWARVLTFSGLAATYSAVLLPQLDPSTSLGAAVVSLFKPEYAKYWTASLLVIGVITELCRRAPGSVDPILPPSQAK